MVTTNDADGNGAITTIDFQLPDPPATTIDNGELAEHWHRVAQQCYGGVLEAACRAGEALIEQRDLCKQWGTNWKGWCEANLCFSHKTATTYMTVATNWERLDEVKRASPDETLSIREAMKLLAGPTEAAPRQKPQPQVDDETPAPIEEGCPIDEIVRVRRAVEKMLPFVYGAKDAATILRKYADGIEAGHPAPDTLDEFRVHLHDAETRYVDPASWSKSARNKASAWLRKRATEAFDIGIAVDAEHAIHATLEQLAADIAEAEGGAE